MHFYDYEWDLYPGSIVFDRELNIEKICWEVGDVFRLVEEDGQMKLIKIDPLEKFIRSKD